LATDSLPALALTSDVAEKGIMDLKPYHPEKEILRGVLPVSIMEAIIAFTTTYGLFLVGLYIWKLPLDHARTLAFTATVIYEFFLVFAIRSTLKSAWEIGFFSNPFLLFAIFVGLSGQMLAIYTNLGHQVFKTVSLPLNQLLLVFACASSGLIIMEILKAIKRRFPQTRAYIPTG
ncbi:MAG TPA: cation-translocating P-type ATPase C-terminal domain-containing protein, partial [Candidatus Bathyarchaeia archaeon]|nr:cation-translocating P-type ATPase C-terminal domain-containing protein [Candidatus Bathyarchaeia archaeon]